MARSYANLLDRVRGGVDPVALHRRTLAQLEEASTDRQARAAIGALLEAFGRPPADPDRLAER